MADGCWRFSLLNQQKLFFFNLQWHIGSKCFVTLNYGIGQLMFKAIVDINGIPKLTCPRSANAWKFFVLFFFFVTSEII